MPNLSRGSIAPPFMSPLMSGAPRPAVARANNTLPLWNLPVPKMIDGVFGLAGLAAAVDPEVELVVQANGRAPQLQSVRLLHPTNSVNFVLAPGNVFRGRVVDDVGDPISEASVRTDWKFETHIETRFDWQTHTDAEG